MRGPVERSLRWYRAQGFYAYSVSKWVPQARKTIDFAGFGDIIAFHPQNGKVIICQATTVSNQAARVSKILSIQAAQVWVNIGQMIHVHGWAKKGPRDKRKIWQLTITPVSFPAIEIEKF